MACHFRGAHHFRGPSFQGALFYAKSKWTQIAVKIAFARGPERGLILPLGAQIVHGPRAQPFLNPAQHECYGDDIEHDYQLQSTLPETPLASVLELQQAAVA